MTDNHKLCPNCGSETVCDEVDIGVGTMHGPAHCNNCGWNEEDEIRETMKLFEIGKEIINDERT